MTGEPEAREAARDLVSEADVNPAQVRSHVLVLLADLDPTHPMTKEQAIQAWALALALRHERDLDDALSWAERARRTFKPTDSEYSEIQLTIAGVLAFQGHFGRAITLLGDLTPPGHLRGRVLYQRAALIEHKGDDATAERLYRESLVMFRDSEDVLGEAHAHNGLGLVLVAQGRGLQALVEIATARALYRTLGADTLAAVADHNLGYAAMHAGQLPLALKLLDKAAAALAELGEPFSEVFIDKAEALVRAGLIGDAAELFGEVMSEMQRGGLGADRPEGLLAMARMLDAAGHTETAREVCSVAIRYFREQDRDAWVAAGELQQALMNGTGARPSGLDNASDLLDLADKANANVAGDAYLEILAVQGPVGKNGKRALLGVQALAESDSRRVAAQGLSHLGEAGPTGDAAYVAALTQLVGARRQGADLAGRAQLDRAFQAMTEAGLRAATSRNDPDLFFMVVVAGLYGTVSPPIISKATSTLWHDLEDNNIGPEEWRQRADKNQDVRPQQLETMLQLPTLGRICQRFSSGETLLASADVDDQLVVLTTSNHSPQLRTLGSTSSLKALSDSWLDSLSWQLRGGSERSHLDQASRTIQEWLAGLINRSTTSVSHMGILEWAPLGLALNVPVQYLRDFARVGAATSTKPGVSHVQGPGLRSGDAEAAALASIWTDAYTNRTTIDMEPHEVQAITHISAHGTFDAENPQLSSYLLSDGELTGYAIEQLQTVSPVVISAACDTGRRAARHGLGLGPAWLAAGAHTVVAPRCVLADDSSTVRAMAAIHTALRQGAKPHEATYALQIETTDSTLRYLGDALMTFASLPSEPAVR